MLTNINKIKSSLSWNPVRDFNYNIKNIPINGDIKNNLDFKDINFIDKIGEGAHSFVYNANIDNNVLVVKVMKHIFSNCTISYCEFKSELCYLSRLNNKNIIKLYGFGVEPTTFIVTEYLENGTLLDFLIKKQDELDNIYYRLYKKFFKKKYHKENILESIDIGLQIANGMKYLHYFADSNSTFIHRDLKPDNIGFDKDFNIKIFDLGLCTLVKKKKYKDEVFKMSGDTGSLRYMAPEVYLKNSYNESCDVYSFGIILWQITTKKIPFQGMNKAEFKDKVILNKYRPKISINWDINFSNLLKKCWDDDFRKRPTFIEIVNTLIRIKDLLI